MADVVSRLALVTGSTSGIGKCIAYSLAAKGHDIALSGFGSEEQIKNVIENCVSRGSNKVHQVGGDLSVASDIQELFKNVCSIFGKGPDILVNNAGTLYAVLICN